MLCILQHAKLCHEVEGFVRDYYGFRAFPNCMVWLGFCSGLSDLSRSNQRCATPTPRLALTMCQVPWTTTEAGLDLLALHSLFSHLIFIFFSHFIFMMIRSMAWTMQDMTSTAPWPSKFTLCCPVAPNGQVKIYTQTPQ